jgi:hypothetical protein
MRTGYIVFSGMYTYDNLILLPQRNRGTGAMSYRQL